MTHAPVFRQDPLAPRKEVDKRNRYARKMGGTVKHRPRKVIAVGLVAAFTGLVVAGATASVKTSGGKSASVQVCVLLPDQRSSHRWAQFDAPDFAKTLKAAAVTYSIANALNDPQKQIAQADQCLANGQFKAPVQADLEEGQRLGVTATPAFFVNGRLLLGAQPLENFARVVDEELDTANTKASAH